MINTVCTKLFTMPANNRTQPLRQNTPQAALQSLSCDVVSFSANVLANNDLRLWNGERHVFIETPGSIVGPEDKRPRVGANDIEVEHWIKAGGSITLGDNAKVTDERAGYIEAKGNITIGDRLEAKGKVAGNRVQVGSNSQVKNIEAKDRVNLGMDVTVVEGIEAVNQIYSAENLSAGGVASQAGNVTVDGKVSADYIQGKDIEIGADSEIDQIYARGNVEAGDNLKGKAREKVGEITAQQAERITIGNNLQAERISGSYITIGENADVDKIETSGRVTIRDGLQVGTITSTNRALIALGRIEALDRINIRLPLDGSKEVKIALKDEDFELGNKVKVYVDSKCESLKFQTLSGNPDILKKFEFTNGAFDSDKVGVEQVTPGYFTVSLGFPHS